MVRGNPRPSDRRPSTIRTFLIADIRGYTRFTAELGDEAGSRLATKFAQVMAEGIEAWGGELVELRGDEALCAFDSARKALRAAVELQDAFADETAAEPHLPLTVGMGLDAGEAVPVGSGYRGAALNLAGRLCAVAAAGEIRATEGLVHLTGPIEGLTYTPVEPAEFKNVKGLVPTVRVDSSASHDPISAATVADDPPQLPAQLDPIVPLAGRHMDRLWLSWHWRRARHGHGRAVVLSGPKGIGKTRLAAEVALDAHERGAVVTYRAATNGSEPPDRATPGPTLSIVDEVERAPDRIVESITHLTNDLDGRRILVVLAHDDSVPASTLRRISRLVTDDRRRELGPLDEEAVAVIAALYADPALEAPPLQLILEESDGIPIAIHRVASQWARNASARRLGESARRTSRERRELRAAETDLIGEVANLELARERTRLIVEEADTSEAGRKAITVCPYKGLAAFEAADAEYYFGRERLVAELIARIVGSPFTGLIGVSGSGKSSAIGAGLLPALEGGVLPGSDQWIQVATRPGDDPDRALRSALTAALPARPDVAADPRQSLDAALDARAAAQRVFLVIDQFEEIFAATVGEAERSAFIELIAEPRPGLKVLVAVRADHYERCAAYPRLATLLGANQVLVGPLARPEVESIIRHPAERVGLRVEPELVDALVADLGTEPGGLPFLSTALLELWEARDGGRLTLAAYRVAGGVRGAVARLAEAVFGQLEDAERAAARSIFLRLAAPGAGGAAVRRRARLDELDPGRNAAMAAALERLTAGRLLTAGEGFVEVAHESLLHAWPRLREWTEEDAADQQLRLHLIHAAHEWDASGRGEGDLYRGPRLATTLDWADQHDLELNVMEHEFVEQSRMVSERDTERQQRANRVLRGLLLGAAAFLVLAIGAGVFAAIQAGRADREAQAARSAELLAEDAARAALARELYASSITVADADPELAILLALEANALGEAPDSSAVTALHRAVQGSRSLVEVTPNVPSMPPRGIGVSLSPDGKTLFTSLDMSSVDVWDVASGALLRTLGAPRENEFRLFGGLTVSPDGTRVAAGDEDAVVHLWEVSTGEEERIQAPGYTPDPPVFSPDGQRLAVTSYATPLTAPAIVTLWDLASTSADPIQTWEMDQVWTISFDPGDGRLLATACPCDPTKAVHVLDPSSPEPELLLEDIPGIVDTAPTSAAFSPDGTLMATAGRDGKINLWSTETGADVSTLVGHTQFVSFVTFSPDGSRLASTSSDGTAKIWDLATERLLMTLAGQPGSLALASFSADGLRLATGSSLYSARVWDLTVAKAGETGAHEFGPPVENVRELAVEGDTTAALVRPCFGFCPGTVSIVDVPSGDQVDLEGSHVGAGVAISPDGQGVISEVGELDANGEPVNPSIRMYELPSGEVLFDADPVCAGNGACIGNPRQAGAFSFSSDGSLVAGALYEIGPGTPGWLAVWDAHSGRLIRAISRREFGFFAPAFSPDASLVAVTTNDDLLVLRMPWLIEEARIPISGFPVQFSPDGKLLAVGSGEGDTTIYEVDGWTVRHELPVISFDLDFNSEGSRLVTADTDGLVRLWDVASGTELQAIPTAGTATRARFTHDDRIVTFNATTLLTLTTDGGELLEVAAGRLTRSLTEEECRRYLHDGCSTAATRRDAGG